MFSDSVRTDVGDLLDELSERPNDLPLAQLVRINSLGLDISVDRTRSAPIVFVSQGRDPSFDGLTPRELEVVTLVAAGFSNQQVATTLFVSLATVKDHLHSVFTKTKLTSRAQVIAAWLGNFDRNAADDAAADL